MEALGPEMGPKGGKEKRKRKKIYNNKVNSDVVDKGDLYCDLAPPLLACNNQGGPAGP